MADKPDYFCDAIDNAAPALQIYGATKQFADVKALQGIDLLVKTGQRVALLGPNGAGKTTLVRAISGRVRLDDGRIEIFSRDIASPSVLDQLGVVPQELAIYSDLTARENLEIFGRLYGLSGRELRTRVSWALEWIGLTDRQHHLTKTFSGGMKRRVNIACGVLHSPRLLLLDEPTVGVDPQSRQRIYDMVAELIQLGTTVVLTTHHLDEAESLCDRILIVDHGKVIADGSLAQLIDQTIGNYQQLELEIEGIDSSRVQGLKYDPSSGTHRCSIHSAGEQIPELLEEIQSLGGQVTHMQLHRADLHEVFLHLTGRELRE